MLVPLAVSTAAVLIGYGNSGTKLALKVVIILSSMPVAFNALIPPSIYDLDLDLANACWFFTTACLVVTLPILVMILKTVCPWPSTLPISDSFDAFLEMGPHQLFGGLRIPIGNGLDDGPMFTDGFTGISDQPFG